MTNRGCGANISEFLLEQYVEEFGITERVVIAVTENRGKGEKIMSLMLENARCGVKITEKIIARAILILCSKSMMRIMLD